MPYPWEVSGAAAPTGAKKYPWENPDPAQLDPGAQEDQSKDSWFTIPNALRIGGGIAGGLAGSLLPGAGTAIGGAAGAGAGEYLAELLEVRRHQREGINPWQVGTQAAIGAVPLGKIGGVASAFVKGGALGAGADVATNLAENGQLPSLKEVGRAGLAGGVFGAGAHAVLSPFMRPRAPKPVGEGQTAAAAGRPVPVAPPEGSPYRSVVRPQFQSFEPPPTVFPDPAEMAMAYQPNLPGAVKAGGRRVGGFDQADNIGRLPEGFDELNAILRGEDPQPLGARPDTNPSLSRPLLPSDLDPAPPVVEQPTRGARYPWEVAEPTPAPEPLSRPEGPFPSLRRPLHPSGLDAAPEVIEQTGGGRLPEELQQRPRARFAFHQPGWEPDGSGGFPMFHVEGGDAHQSTVSAETLRELGIDVPEIPGEALSRPPGPHPSLTRPLNPSGLDANPPTIHQQPLVHPRRVEDAIRDYVTSGSPERAMEVAETIDSEPGAREAIVNHLREKHGDNIPVYRAGEVIPGQPQSWTTDRAIAEKFSDPAMHGTAEARPITEATVRPEDVLFPGAGTDQELVIDGAKVQPVESNPLADVLPKEEAEGGAPGAAAPEAPVANPPVRPGAPLSDILPAEETGSKISKGGFKLPEKHVSDAEFERIRAKLPGAPVASPWELAERRGSDIGAPPGSVDRRAPRPASVGPVLDAAGREIAPPQAGDPVRPPGPWDRNQLQTPVEEAPQPSAPVRTAPEAPSGRRVGPKFVDVDPDAVGVDAKTYQFKGGGDAAGVTDRLAKVESWDPIAGEASPIITHERANGAEFVVDGHQRLGLAKRLKLAGRSGAPQTLRAIRLSEREGVTVPQARRIGAMLNLQQGTGSATDVAKVLREAPLTSLERARIPKDQVSGSKLRMGEDLAKLGDDAFLRVVNGQVHENPARNEAYGAIVGRLISDPAEQVGALQQLAKAAPENAYQAEQFVKAIVADGFERGTQTNLFGTQEVANSLADPIAKIMAAARRTLTSEKSALGNALRNEERLAAKGNTLNRAGNQAGFEQAGALDKLLDTYGHTAGPVREELKRVAALVEKGELAPHAAANQVLDAVERERKNLGAPQPAVRPGVQPNDGSGGPPRPGAQAQAPAPVARPELPQANPAEAEDILKQLAKTINVDNKPLVDELPPLRLTGEKETAPLSRAEKEAAGQTNIFDGPEESAAGKRKVDRGDYTAKDPMATIEAAGFSVDGDPGALSLTDERVSDGGRGNGRTRTPPEEVQAALDRLNAAAQPSADLPKELASLDELRPRHEVRNPEKATEIAESMKRVGWKGRPVLVVNDNGERSAWTGTHRLAAAKEAGLAPKDVPTLEVDGSKLRAAGYDVAELTAMGKNARIKALRKAGLEDAAQLLEEERGAKARREAAVDVQRDKGQNPRALGTNPRALAKAEELLNNGDVDEAEKLMGRQMEARIKAAFKHGSGGSGSTLVGGLAPFDTETFRRLVQKHPESAWRATSMAIGAATGWQLDEDHPGRGVILGLMAGAAAGSLPKFVRAIQTAEIKTRVGGIDPVRMARDPKKDIGLFELIGGTPERTIPEQFERARPAFEKFIKALRDEHTRTGEIIPQKRVQALRDRYVTPIIADIRKDARLLAADKSNPQPYKSKYITAFANRLAGHRTIGQRVFQTLTKGKLPPDFIERRVGDAVYYSGTGAALDTALQNTTQPMLALAHIPFKYIAGAYKDLATNPAAKRMVEGALLPLEKPSDAIELTMGPFGRKVRGWTKNLPDPQWALRMTDQKNREVVYYAGRKFAESKGLDEAAADTWARQVMRKTQTEPGALGSNPFHAGPVAGSLKPFTKYPTVFTEHMVDLAKQAAAGKNLGGVARLGGTMLGAILLGKAAGVDMEDLLVSGGRPLGIDISHPQRSLERIATGKATPVTRGVFDLMAHLDGSADHDLTEDAANLAIPRYARKVGDAIGHFKTEGASQPHVTRGPGGKVRDITTPAETVMNLVGLKTTRQTDRREKLTDFYDTATHSKEVYEADRRRAYEDLSRAIDSNDHAKATDAIRRIGSAAAVRQFMRERRMLPEDRFYKTLPPRIRLELRSALEDTKATAPGTHR